MLCNIFPILSSQLMKISSFEQFLVLKKNIWAWQSMEHDHLNKLSITFQQKDQCEIWWRLAKWFLKNHDCINVNSTVAGKYYKYKPDDGHLRFPIRTILTTADLRHFDNFNINEYGPYKWGSKFDLGGKKVKCQHRTIILAILVDLLSPIISAKIRTQGLFGYGEEDF